MSGPSLPYHLRLNKAVDRNLFIETVRMLDRVPQIDIPSYRYVGFAGPHLEEFKILHSSLGLKNMISLEKDEALYKRQRFNCPLDCIELLKTESTSFIPEYDWEMDTLFWLDYTSPKQINIQLSEFKTLIEDAPEYTIVKLTLNAHTDSLGTPSDFPEEYEEGENKESFKNKYRVDKLTARLGAYVPAVVDVTSSGLPKTLLKAIQLAVEDARAPFIPLTAFYYQDHTQMMTTCGIVIEPENMDSMLELSGLAKWEFFLSEGWDSTPYKIALPDLTLKERIALDGALYETDFENCEGLTCVNEYMEREQMESYRIYNRFCPLFGRIQL